MAMPRDDLSPSGSTPRPAQSRAWDLWFETGDGVARYPAHPASRPRPSDEPAGWIGSAGPAVDPATWPRGSLTGLPMFHAVTLLLPTEFRRRGPGLPAVSFFQGEGQFAHARRGVDDPADPFVADLLRTREHPHLGRRIDIIDGQFALLWLTREEYDAGPTAPPPDARRPGEHVADDEGPNAWDEHQPTVRLWLADRPDPNAGHAPVDPMDWDRTDGFVPPPRTDDWKLAGWAEDLHLRSHLGGTSLPVQTLVDGFTPYYLELEELPGLNFGGGNAQIDLESEAFDWACG